MDLEGACDNKVANRLFTWILGVAVLNHFFKRLSRSQESSNDRTKFVAILLLGATGIAFAPIFAKLAMDTDQNAVNAISPAAVAFWRLFLAIPFFAIFLIYSDETKVVKMPSKGKGWMLLLPGCFFAADLSCWHWAFKYTSVANATLEANLASILVAIFGWLFLSERFGWKFPVGGIIALIGLIFLVWEGTKFGDETLKGDLLGFMTAFCYGGYIVSIKVLTVYFSVARIMFMTTLIGAFVISVCLGLIYGHLGSGVLLPQVTWTWVWLICLAAVPQIIGQALITKGISHLPASFSAITLLWQPVMTAVLGWFVLSQPMTMLQIAAGCFILFGIFLARQGTDLGTKKD